MHVRQHQPSQRLPLDHRNCTITATNFASSPSATRRPSGVQKGRQRPLGTGPIMTPVLTGHCISTHRWGSHGHKPWLWPYRWGDSAHPPISARGTRHLITVIYSCRILFFSAGITSIHKGSTCVRAIASKQTRSTFRVKFQHRLRQLSYSRKKQQQQQQQPSQRCICML